jgi:uncharacterized phage protein (TIGR01671 family)
MWDKFNCNMSYQKGSLHSDLKRFVDNYYEHVEGGNGMILMQFTGLKDKNGKGVYEGDILEHSYEDKMEDEGYGIVRNAVCFHQGSFCWIGEVTGEPFPFENADLNDLEIAGNIYENPKLLEQ